MHKIGSFKNHSKMIKNHPKISTEAM